MTDRRRLGLDPFSRTATQPSVSRTSPAPAPTRRHGHPAHATPDGLAGRAPSTGGIAPRRAHDLRTALGSAGAAQRANLRRFRDMQDATYAGVLQMQRLQVRFSTGLAMAVVDAANRPGQSYEEQVASAMALLDLSVQHEQEMAAVFGRLGFDQPIAQPHAPSMLSPQYAMAEAGALLGNSLGHEQAMHSAQAEIGGRLSHESAMAEARAEIGQGLSYESAMAEAYAEMGGGLSYESAMAEAQAEIGQSLSYESAMAEAYAEMGGGLSYESAMAQAQAEIGQSLSYETVVAAADQPLGGRLHHESAMAAEEDELVDQGYEAYVSVAMAQLRGR